MQRRGNT